MWVAFQMVPITPLGVHDSIRFFETPLVSEFDHGKKVDVADPHYLAQFGITFHFFNYLMRLCPSPNLLTNLISSTSKLTGVEFVDEIIKIGYKAAADQSIELPEFCQDFSKLFVQFQKTRAKHHLTNFRTRYRPEDYIQFDSNLTIKPHDRPIKLKPYSAAVYKMPDKGCREGDYELSSADCLQIQLGDKTTPKENAAAIR